MVSQQETARDWFSKPGDSIRGLLVRKNLAPQELAAKLADDMTLVRGLLAGSISIDQNLADSLSKNLGGSPEFWIRRQAHYDAALEKAVSSATSNESDLWLRNVPIDGPAPAGKLNDAKRREEIKRRLVFFGVPTIRSWEARYGRFRSGAHFRTSQAFVSKPSTTILWLRRGEIECDLVATRPWNPGNLRDRLVAVRGLSRISHPSRFLPKLRQLCSEAGVALVVVRAPAGCYASGASALVAPDKAMLLVSFRHRADDHFWFTVFHEMGHLLLHSAQTFVDDKDTPEDKSEQEANEFARACIVPEARVDELNELPASRDAVVRFSVSVGIAPGLTVGQMQRRGKIPYSKLNSLKRYWTWSDIDPASISRESV